MKVANVVFPEYAGVRCLMMPYIQGELSSVPEQYRSYAEIIKNIYLKRGDLGFLTIDESPVLPGNAHRGARAKFGRALHTEAGLIRGTYGWGDEPPVWGGRRNVTLDVDTKILLANNLSDSCAVWNAEHRNTSADGDIGDQAAQYPYSAATLLKAGEVHEIGILTPHESLPVKEAFNRQFLRIIGSGVHGREEYFTRNPLLA
jgi:hypothetical protein